AEAAGEVGCARGGRVRGAIEDHTADGVVEADVQVLRSRCEQRHRRVVCIVELPGLRIAGGLRSQQRPVALLALTGGSGLGGSADPELWTRRGVASRIQPSAEI